MSNKYNSNKKDFLVLFFAIVSQGMWLLVLFQ